MVEAFEAQHNVKFKPKYYAGGDNMLAALSQSPPGTFDIVHTDAEYARILIERGSSTTAEPSHPLRMARSGPVSGLAIG